MKKLLTVIFAICPMIASADYLDDKIANLTKQKLDKIAKLQECQKNTKGLKIAGITTLGVSAIGIGANIGEAVALNKLDDKIDTAVKTKSSLDTEIGKLKQPVKDATPQQNWADCGEQSLCTNKEMFLGSVYGAVEAICVNGAWKIGGCESGLISTNQQYCVINNTPVPYYDACELANPGQDPANTCGVRTCNADAASQSDLDDLNAKEAICINGVWEAKICKDNFAGTEMTCTKNGQPVTYFKDCNPVVPGTVEKSCDAITQEWLNANNAKTGACDKTNGENYITECADKFNGVQRTTGNKQGYEKCEKSGNVQPTIPERKLHSECTPAEHAEQVANGADKTWIYNNRCVPRSCKGNYFLVIKNGETQGYCKSTCPDYQQVSWGEGGKACEITKVAQEEIASCGASCSTQCGTDCLSRLGAVETVCINGTHKPTNCSAGSPIGEAKRCKNGNAVVTYYEACPKSSENVVPECQEKKQGWTYYKMVGCNAFASVCGYQYTTSCSISMGVCDENLCVQYLKNQMRNKGDAGIELRSDPSNAKNKSSGTVAEKKELAACKSFSVPNVGSQMACYNMCTKDASVKNCKINKAIISNNECVCNPGTGRNMGGRLITYNYSYDTANYEAIATFAVDGQQYSAVGHVMLLGPSKHEQTLNRKVTEKLESLGYSNFKISCNGCP